MTMRLIGPWRAMTAVLARRGYRLPITAGGVITGLFVLTAAFPWLLSTHDPMIPTGAALSSPQEGLLFGTDELGRDLYSRVVHGARFAAVISIGGIALAYLAALPFGLASGFFSGRVDRAILTVSDTVLTFPSIVLAIVLVSVIGSGVTGLVMAVAVTQAPALVRYIRGFVYPIRSREYVDASRASGGTSLWIMRKHVLRSVAGHTAVMLSLMASEALLIAAALGFLGLGVQPPDPEWGTMLSRSRTHFLQHPHLMVFPGLAIGGVVLGFNLLGDGIRDYLDKQSQR